MSPGKALSIRGLATAVPGFTLRDVSLDVPPGQCMVVLGPTGSGKSMLAETICGLRQAAAGRVSIGDRDVTALDPARRRIGYVPQDHALLPFKNVQQNVAFALRAQRLPRREVQHRTADVLKILGMVALARRRVRELSGGERQRLALGRALAMRPELLLLDEPLASLDQRTAEQLIAELLRMRRDSGITSLHICHSLDEALSQADHLAIIRQGRMIQTGPPMRRIRRSENDGSHTSGCFHHCLVRGGAPRRPTFGSGWRWHCAGVTQYQCRCGRLWDPQSWWNKRKGMSWHLTPMEPQTPLLRRDRRACGGGSLWRASRWRCRSLMACTCSGSAA